MRHDIVFMYAFDSQAGMLTGVFPLKTQCAMDDVFSMLSIVFLFAFSGFSHSASEAHIAQLFLLFYSLRTQL